MTAPSIRATVVARRLKAKLEGRRDELVGRPMMVAESDVRELVDEVLSAAGEGS